MSLGGSTPLTGKPIRRTLAAGCLALLACSPAPRWIAVADGRGASVLLFDPDLTSADTVRFNHRHGPLGDSHRVQFSNGGAAALLGFRVPQGDDVVLRIRLGDGEIVDRWPPGLHPVPDIWTYVSASRTLIGVGTDPMAPSPLTGYVSLVLPDQDWSERRLPACGGAPTGLAPFGRGDRIYLSCDAEPGIIVEIDRIALRVVRTSTNGLAGCHPDPLAFSRNEGILFVLCQGSGWLLYLDRVSLLPIDSVEVGHGVSDLLVLPRTPEAILTVPHRNELVVLNLHNRAVQARIKMVETPRQGTVTHDGRAAYVTTLNDGARQGSLVKIDLVRGQIVASTPIPGGATAVAAWPGLRSPRLDWR